ncbi:MAG: hybrid sensor histidine kinase/response regulator [Bacteroidales bacterium]|jgi:two-component system sensor histidine kinase/response regulator|nr:hybrid sensor histidine kinase/response regulator [Bacteroidales bacterium]
MEVNSSDYTILITDDVKANVILLKAIIKKCGYKVLEASNGKECLEVFHQQKPDLILLDIMMPIMNGYEVMEAIRGGDFYNDVTIIFITALDNKSDVIKGLKAGANDYISKPFNGEELEVRVKHQISLVAAKRKIEEQTQSLINTIKNRDKLYSVIAHDLRSPLSSIKMIINLLVDELGEGKIDEELYNLLNEANTTTENLFILLDNLLKWTKTQLGKFNISVQKIDINALMEGLLNLYSLLASNKNIKIIVDNQAKQLEINSDPDIVKTITRNLLSNAIKFSYEGGEITLTIKEDGDNLQVSVKDNGIGIADKDKNFVLSDKETGYSSFGTANEEGSGLGLSLCQDFVHKLKGKIWFESEFEKGSTFYFSIPKNLVLDEDSQEQNVVIE